MCVGLLNAVGRLVAPGEEVARVSGFGGALPLLIEASGGAVGRGFENNFAIAGNGGAERGQSFSGEARPAGDLGAMQVLDGEAAAGVGIGGGGHARLTIHSRGERLSAASGRPRSNAGSGW